MQPLERAHGIITSPASPTLIEIEHLSRSIGTGNRKTIILDNVTFRVPAQSLFAITGPSGSGKSTILNMLTGIDRPTGGRILFAGRELRAMSEDQLARWRGKHVGIIFQFFQLLPTLTALENVLLALELGGGGGLSRRRWPERAMTCLALAQIADLARRLPGELSGGEQQRVAIARALANDPPVIVADEPTGNLDSRTAHDIFRTLSDLTHYGKTVVYVTHALELAVQATARIALLDGRVIEQRSLESTGSASPAPGGVQ